MGANAGCATISNHHPYNRETGQIEFVTQNDEIYEVLKHLRSICAEVFSCARCNGVHITIRYYNVFLGLTLCKLCTDAIDSVSMVPFVITNARTGERHRLELALLK